uniref:FAD-binding domain-containing protein n=2 Tax=Chrysotila carterae TaxID=13221 RepID=A0A7S4BNL2_CHRCT
MIYITPQCLPNFNGIALPETGGKVNLAMGCPTSAKVPAALESDDVTAVADYLRDNFKAFALPFEAVAKQWVAQPWNTTGMVHCNFYHSSTLRLAIMGDAAHATSPSIGQGMNTALADAAAFDDLLDRHYDDIDAVLPAFSKERVKEGNALTSIAYYVYPMSDFQNLRNTVVNILRNILHRYLPSLVAPDPLVSIGKGGKLSEAYAEMTRMGRLAAARRVNDDLRRGWFEKRVGLIKA